MTPLELVPLRLAATAAHALPGVRLRLRDGATTLLEVAAEPVDGAPRVTPCGFRNAVAAAHCKLQAGERLRFLDLAEGVAPAIDVGLRPGDRVHADGIYRVASTEAVVHAFATTLPPRACRTRLAELGAASAAVGLHHDAGTEVSVLHVTSPLAEDDGRVPDVLSDLVMACFVEEISQELARR